MAGKKVRPEEEMMATVMRVSTVSVAANFILSAFKLIAGILGNSGAMISDAIHSASDVFSTLVVMIGARVSGKEADEEHPYGHERMECGAAIILSGLLFATGLMIGYQGVQTILHAASEPPVVPSAIALAAAVISIVVKEGMFWYTQISAKRINSTALMADAWHHRSDALSSVGALVGIGGAMLGVPLLDPIASLVICVFILKAAYDIFKSAFDKLVDRSCDAETEKRLRHCALEQEGVLGVDLLHTRLFGSRIYVEMEILADGSQTLTEAHDIAEAVHDRIEQEFPLVKHVMIHVNPK